MIDLPQDWTPIDSHPGLEYRYVDYQRVYKPSYAYMELPFFEFRIDGYRGKAPVDWISLTLGSNRRAFEAIDQAISTFLAGYEFRKVATKYVV